MATRRYTYGWFLAHPDAARSNPWLLNCPPVVTLPEVRAAMYCTDYVVGERGDGTEVVLKGAHLRVSDGHGGSYLPAEYAVLTVFVPPYTPVKRVIADLDDSWLADLDEPEA